MTHESPIAVFFSAQRGNTMNLLLYYYHRTMKRIHQRPGFWQTKAFFRHRNKMKEYEGRLKHA